MSEEKKQEGTLIHDNILRITNAINKAAASGNDEYEKVYKALRKVAEENEKLKKNQADNIKIIGEKDEMIKELKKQLVPEET